MAIKRYEDNYTAAGFGREFAWLDLANTLEWDGYGKVTDHLSDPVWLSRILKRWKMATQVPRPVPNAKLFALRSLLRDLAAKLSRGVTRDRRYRGPECVPERTGARETVPAPKWSAFGTFAGAARLAVDPFAIRGVLRGNAGARPAGPAEILPQRRMQVDFYDRTKGNTRRWCNDRLGKS